MEPEELGAGGAHGFIRIIFPAPEEKPFSSKEILVFLFPPKCLDLPLALNPKGIIAKESQRYNVYWYG